MSLYKKTYLFEKICNFETLQILLGYSRTLTTNCTPMDQYEVWLNCFTTPSQSHFFFSFKPIFQKVKSCNAFTGDSNPKQYSSWIVTTLNHCNNICCIVEIVCVDYVVLLNKNFLNSDHFHFV